MTPHHSLAYVRHIRLAPAANLSTSSAIVFVSIKARMGVHFVDCLKSCMTQMTKDFARRHENYVEQKGIAVKSVCDKLSISNYIF